MSDKIKIGIIGCGAISAAYLNVLAKLQQVEVEAVADINQMAATKRAHEFNVHVMSVEDLLADPKISTVLNLTIPAAHASVGMAALEAGKSVYNEKPLTITREEGAALLALAAKKGLRVGCAPDTFFGAAHQACRKLIDDGAIGTPVAGIATMTCRGHESWHPSPEFYYKVGGGPVFDMGPYYLTNLVQLLGPVKSVVGMARKTFPTRTITSQPLNGKVVDVDVPTNVMGVLEFACGAVVTLIMSFDIWAAELPRIEIYGSEGTLSVPDPNGFGGTPKLWTSAEKRWQDVSIEGRPYAGNGRGIGVTDMAVAAKANRPHRASGELAFHVLDIMHALHDASEQQKQVTLTSTCARPAPLPADLQEGWID